jgi:transposase
MQRYLDLYNDGHSVREIAAMHSVNTSTIWKMLKMHPDYVARSE